MTITKSPNHQLGQWTAVAAMGVLCSGCLIDAGKLAGFSNPKVKISKTWGGVDVEVGTDFTGKAVGEYDPETKKIKFEVEVNSGVSSVVNAEGLRADHLIELRKIEATYYLEAQKAAGENFKAFGTMLAIATAAGGDAVAKVVDAAGPILKGSAISLPAGIGATLGSTGPPAPPP